jgi:hypothetical protein
MAPGSRHGNVADKPAVCPSSFIGVFPTEINVDGGAGQAKLRDDHGHAGQQQRVFLFAGIDKSADNSCLEPVESMNEYTLIWLFAAAFAGIVALAASVTLLKIQMTALQTTQDTLIKLLGSKAAFLLHSPHTPELDLLIDKFRDDNINPTERQKLSGMLTDIERNQTLPKTERLLASLVLLPLECVDKKTLKKLNGI